MNVLRFRPRNTAIAVGSLLILAVFGMVYLGGSSRSPYLGLRDTLGKGSRHFSAEDGLSHSRLLHEWGTIPVVVVEEHHEGKDYLSVKYRCGQIHLKKLICLLATDWPVEYKRKTLLHYLNILLMVTGYYVITTEYNLA